MGRGRKTEFDPKFHPQLAKFMDRCGLTEHEIAQELKVTEQTIRNWKKKSPDFFEALKENKTFIDSLVEDSLLKRALGYEVTETKVLMTDAGGEVQGQRIEQIKKHIPPDTTACIFWLKNRQRSRWTDVTRTENFNMDWLEAVVKHNPEIAKQIEESLEVVALALYGKS